MQGGSLPTILLFILCGVCLCFSAVVLWSLFQKKDERRALILLKSAAASFLFTLLLLVLDALLPLLRAGRGLGSLALLCGALVAFSAFLAHYSKKYGG